MKILVTGGAGYIGSHCVKALADAGHQIIIFDNLSSGHQEKQPAELMRGDLRNKEDIRKACNITQFDAVMHFAAKIEVKESQENPGLYYENNVLGSINLLEAMREKNIKTIVFSSTAAVYGNPQSVPIKEESPIAPINVYGKTKAMIEQIIAEYHRAYGVSATVFRYFNAAGAAIHASLGENHNPETHLIPLCIKKALQNEQFTINGNNFKTPDGTAVRDYVHVLDIATAHVLGLEYAHFEKTYKIFNIGTGQGYSVLQIVTAIENLINKKMNVIYGPPREGDPDILIADATKIIEILGWKPQYSALDTILQTAIHWHKKMQDKKDEKKNESKETASEVSKK